MPPGSPVPFACLFQLSLVTIQQVAQCAGEKSQCSLFCGSFDTYQYLGESLIRSLFTKGSAKVSDHDLLEFATAFQLNLKSRNDGCNVLGIHTHMLENIVSELSSGERDNPVSVCLKMFLLWRTSVADGGTYESLKCRFDMFSVFAGRNPLVGIIRVIGTCCCALVMCQPYLLLFPTGSGRS